MKNWVTTLGGILAGLGTLPLLVTASHVSFPLWWNECQFPLFLCGGVGTILLGLSAKGTGEHSTTLQVEQATTKAVATAAAECEEKKQELGAAPVEKS
jgi:hypothetical protein